MNEQERRKQRVYDHIGTALECIGSVLGGPYGLDLDNAVTRRICRIKLVEARDALNAAINESDAYAEEFASPARAPGIPEDLVSWEP